MHYPNSDPINMTEDHSMNDSYSRLNTMEDTSLGHISTATSKAVLLSAIGSRNLDPILVGLVEILAVMKGLT